MAIRWSESIERHGIELEDAVHAMLNAYAYVPGFDEARRPEGLKPDLWIGPQRRLGAPLLEVMAEVTPPRDVRIFHVMELREKFRYLIEPLLDGE